MQEKVTRCAGVAGPQDASSSQRDGIQDAASCGHDGTRF